jgi:hypothetical protein
MSQKGFAPILIILLIGFIVGIGGFFIYEKYMDKSYLPPDSKPIPTNVSYDNTAHWKTYTGLNIGISFKYPQSYQIREIVSGSSDKPEYSVDLYDQNTDISIFSYKVGRDGGGVAKKEQIFIDRNPATRFDFGNTINQINSVQISVDNINHTDNDITIMYGPRDIKNFLTEGDFSTLNQILSTLKFTQ